MSLEVGILALARVFLNADFFGVLFFCRQAPTVAQI